MSKKIYPGIAARLEFIVEDTDGLPVPSLTHSDTSSAGYRDCTDGVVSSTTPVSLTSSVAATASVNAGQFVTIDGSRGHYAIDVPSGAAGASLDYAEAVVVFTAGHTVTPIQHEIDLALQTISASYVKVAIDIPDAISGVASQATDIQDRIPAALFDGRMSVDVRALEGSTQSLTDLKDFADAGYDPLTHKVQGVVLVDTLTTYSGNTPQTGDSFARIGVNGAGLTSLASAAQVSSLQVNTRTNIQVPIEIETPDSGTQVWKIRMFLFDEEGNMEAPDSTPTITLTNAAGTDRSSRLSSATTLSTGAYSWDYTATAGDAEEQLVWVFTVVEGGLTRIYPATSYVVEETAYRFSSTDRATLNATATATALAAVDTKLGTPAGASVSADIAAVKSDTNTLVSRVTTTVATLWANLTAMITGSGASAKYTVTALENAPSGGGGSSLSGPYTRTLTVTDADTSDPIELAVVRLYKTGSSETQETNSSGVVEYAVSAATWSYSISASGYAGATGTIVVSDDGDTPIQLTALNITPSTGNFTTGFVTTWDGDGVKEPGAIVYSELTKPPVGDTGGSYDSIVKTNVSDLNSLVQILGLVKGGTYRIWRGQRRAGATDNLYLIPTDAGSTYELPSHIGREQ